MNQPVVDIRSPQEFWRAHSESAINLPHDQLLNETVSIEGLEKSNQVLIYCRRRARPAIVNSFPPQEGFKHVTNGESMTALLLNHQEVHHAHSVVARFVDKILAIAIINTGCVVD